VTLKFAITIDSAIADHYGRSRWITGAASRREVHRLRAAQDALAVGVETVLADDPSLTVRGRRPPRVAPARIVFDRSARTPVGSRLVRSAREVRTIIVTAPGADIARKTALADLGVTVLEEDGLAASLEALHQLSIRSLLVEGGARLGSALLNEALVDRLIIFRAPLLLGSGATSAFSGVGGMDLAQARRFLPIARRRLGDDMMTVYAHNEDECSPG
jgi:diaminohydroxyphosphoribosylaminopyrimidine deaminase/5-amino-6-(5-phosphoribosylamino)uracil reductase